MLYLFYEQGHETIMVVSTLLVWHREEDRYISLCEFCGLNTSIFISLST